MNPIHQPTYLPTDYTLQILEGSEAGGQLKKAVGELARADRQIHAPLQIIAAGSGSALEMHFNKLLVDDRNKLDQSYVEYLCTVHKQIQNRMAR